MTSLAKAVRRLAVQLAKPQHEVRRIAKPARQREGGDVLAGVHQQPPGLVQAQYQNALIERDDFLLNPHIAWSSEDAMQQLMDSAVDNISAFVARQIRGNDSRRA